MRIEYHRTLVSDRVRNEAFHAALKAVIKPGETVVADIGTGTGLLGMMAAGLGAKEVFMYESEAVAGLAQQLIETNDARNCLIIPCHSLDMARPPRADVIVSETLGNYPLEEDIISTLRDGIRRHLKPGGIIMPRHIRQLVAPVIVDRVHKELTTWDDVGYGIDFRLARKMSLNNIYVRLLSPDDLMKDAHAGIEWDSFDLSQSPKTTRKGSATFAPAKPVTVYGFAIWWTAELVPGVILSTAPDAPRTHWEQLYLPMFEPVYLGGGGERVSITLRSKTSREMGTTLTWSVTHEDKTGQPVSRQAMDLEKGYLP